MPNERRDTRTPHAPAEALQPAEREQAPRAAEIAEDEFQSATPDTRGPSPGPAPPSHRGPQSAAGDREGPDLAALASFTRELAELAAADPEDPGTVGQEESPEDAVEEPQLELAPDDVATTRPARKESADLGGTDEPEGSPPHADSPPAAPSGPSAPPRPVARLRPATRVAWLGLDDALEAGRAAGILVGWPAELAVLRIPRLTTPDWLALAEALRLCPTKLGAAVVLKGLAAHCPPKSLPALAARAADLGDTECLARLQDRGPAPSGDCTARKLRLHHDPVASLSDDALPPEVEAEERWPLPRWLKGVPRAPLDLAIVAVDQALTDDLLPGHTTHDGASDSLTAALAPHGQRHPSLARWFLGLAARADSRDGLDAMREAMLQARLELSI